jgi:hypothetical protein
VPSAGPRTPAGRKRLVPGGAREGRRPTLFPNEVVAAREGRCRWGRLSLRLEILAEQRPGGSRRVSEVLPSLITKSPAPSNAGSKRRRHGTCHIC